ncbi:alpha/beta hydrolase [uncultured Gimesia sp.]|uniref:alpha/beta fold hydrolase n=1 Tax=uncultured Gimesia sp. TaxID=1678688 RepID=UPI002631D941|nr:alpha/beta hydrolase [uncultured Gimesia sp.]
MQEPLILIPGLGSTHITWQHQIQHLGDLFDVQSIVCDQPLRRAELVEVLLSQAPERFCLAGHSFGGWLAQAVAAAAPERVTKLMLLNTYSQNNAEHRILLDQFLENIRNGLLIDTLDANLKTIIHPDRMQDQEFVEPLLKMLKGFSSAGYESQVQAMINDYATEDLLPDITCPTLVVHAREDLTFPIKELQFIADHILSAKFTIIEDSGHMSPMERPQAITALMRLWFAG